MSHALRIQLVTCGLLLGTPQCQAADPSIEQDTIRKTVTISDGVRNLVLRVNYDNRCMLDQVRVMGREVVPGDTGVCSAVKVGGQWFTTRGGLPLPRVTVSRDSAAVSGIRFGGGGIEAEEVWTFRPHADRITWRIDRTYRSGGILEDTYFPGWDFRDMATWTGALLGNGGVAWCKLFDKPMATYGLHTGPVTFWNKESGHCLRVLPTVPPERKIAARFSRHPSGIFSFNYTVTDDELTPKYDLRRFLADKQDVWAPFSVSAGAISVELALSVFDYAREYDRGAFKSVDGKAITEILNTIGRIGAIDDRIVGSNGWYSGYACLHEPWFAQMGLAINDPDYTQAFANCLDWFRDHAITPEGRVKSRWAYGAYDAMPGTYDKNGFYECQWGWLMDTQPCWVINVAEQFDLTGDVEWLRRHKKTCERVLDYMLRRDSNGNGLVEVMTDSHTAAKGSDWIDVIWAAFETAYVNAQMYHAMILWADCEDLLGDREQAGRYRESARKLKDAFNKPIAEGGFWNPNRKWYVYWRDKDGSIHGDNLVVPVNFMAIGYGLCDDPSWRAAILDQIEAQMRKENLFFWPLCIYSYRKDEVMERVNWPFPNYENGDIFLAWGELGTRAYAAYNPAVAVKYVKNVLEQYARDGLAFQRYLRKTQKGEGDDILSNNCNPVVGLYRNIYGIRPKHNRLYLDPHLTPELNGTRLKYRLRNQVYTIDLGTDVCRLAADGFTLWDKGPFALHVCKDKAEYFCRDQTTPSLTVTRSIPAPTDIRIESRPRSEASGLKWTESSTHAELKTGHVVGNLAPDAEYRLYCNGQWNKSVRADASGRLAFDHTTGYAGPWSLALSSPIHSIAGL